MTGYCVFLAGLLVLILGYVFYGRVMARIFKPDNRVTPAIEYADGVDYVVMPRWRIFLIQLLNIAGLGPIFGAVLGALYGPAALLWIVIGCIFAGMVHDYVAGMISLRHKGENLPEILGHYLGDSTKWAVRVICIVFNVLVGVVFAVGPATLLAPLTESYLGIGVTGWLWIIFGYYFLATVLPIQAIMGRIYPFFSIALVIMVAGILGVLLCLPFAEQMPAWMCIPRGLEVLPNLEFFSNQHPHEFPLFPVMFITIACGAISGFHATQSPLMARCMKTEKEGLPIFGGAMITEGIIALIWAVAVLTFFGSSDSLLECIVGKNGAVPATAIKLISETWLGQIGSVLVLLGVVILPISSGDSALRVTRLMIADCFNISQVEVSKRLCIAIPVFAIAITVCSVDYQLIWQYFGWGNQVLASITLWMISVYLRSKGSFYWISAVPALFLSMVVLQYFFSSPQMLGLNTELSLCLSAVGVALVSALCLVRSSKLKKDNL